MGQAYATVAADRFHTPTTCMVHLPAVAILLSVSRGAPCNDRPLPSRAPASSCADFQAQGLCEKSQKAEWYCPKTCDLCAGDDAEDQCEYHGKKYKHGFHGCYDKCYAECEGKRWLCWHGEWYDKGECESENVDECIGDDGTTYEENFHACYDTCEPECTGNRWICHHGDWLPMGHCNAGKYSDSAFEWSVFRDAAYMRLTSMSQPEANAACKAVGGTAVAIKNEDENEFVRTLCSSYGPCWIGLAELSHSEEWRWTDGSRPLFLNWHHGEPNNWHGVDENAAIINYPAGSTNGEWFDAPSDWDGALAICKRPLSRLEAARIIEAVDDNAASGDSMSHLVWMLLGAALAFVVYTGVSMYRRAKRVRQFSAEDVDADDNLGVE